MRPGDFSFPRNDFNDPPSHPYLSKLPNIGCTCSHTAKSTIPQAADERKVIVPRCEIERRVKGAAERRKRMLSTIENFGGAHLQASGHGRRPVDGGNFGVTEAAETTFSTAAGIPRGVCRTSKASAPPDLRQTNAVPVVGTRPRCGVCVALTDGA
jgi:hypothetical protein